MPDDIHEIAAYVKAKRVVDGEVRRDIWKATAAAFFAAVTIGIVVAVWTGGYFRDNARANATRNCHAQALGRETGNGRAFVQRQVLVLADRAFQQFPHRFRDAQITRINHDLVLARSRLAATAPRSIRTFSDLQSLLPLQPLINCDQLVR